MKGSGKKSIGLWKFNSKDKIYVNLFAYAWKIVFENFYSI